MHGSLVNATRYFQLYETTKKRMCSKICWPTFKLNVCKWLIELNGPEARQCYLFHVFVRFFPLTQKNTTVVYF